MKTTKNLTIFILLIGILSAFGFTHQKADWGSPEKGIIMQYHQPVGTVNKYALTTSSSQELNVMGNVQSQSGATDGEVSHKISKIAGGIITHELAFTKLTMSSESAMGSMNTPTESILNKPLIVESGKIGEKPNPKNVKDLPIAGQGALPEVTSAIGILAELSPRPVKINDKWTTTQNITLEHQGNKFETSTVTTYTFVGVEKKMGYDCMKITGDAKTTLKGNANIQTMDMELESEGTSKVTAYFAYKQGFFVELSSEDDGDMTIDVPANGMVIDATNSAKIKFTFVSTSAK